MKYSDELIRKVVGNLEQAGAFGFKHELETGGLERYVEFGNDPGGFLVSVLEGDLFGAVNKADNANYARLADWAMLVHRNIPADARGSRRNVERWLAHNGMTGLKEVA